MKPRPTASFRCLLSLRLSQVSVFLIAAVIAAVATSAAAQRQFELLRKRGLPADAYARVAVLGDVDGDGDLDLILGNGGTGYLAEQSRLYLNNGTGTFTDATASRLPVGSYYTTSLGLGDVDRDGDLDLVVGNWGSSGGQSRLYLNDGKGQFTDATASRMPAGSYATLSLALGDVDGDGDLDLVLGNGREQSRLYSNDGRGTFSDATASRLPVGSYHTTSLGLGDVDLDGDLDLLVGNWGQQSLLYLNDGKGQFTDATASRMPAGISLAVSLALGDVDSDRDLDLVVGNSGPNLLYLNDGKGQFTDATASRMPVGPWRGGTTSLALGDVDRDRALDLVIGNDAQSLLFLNDGAGIFVDATASRMPVGDYFTRSVALGDVDGDGDLDLLLANGNGVGEQSRLYLNSGTGTFTDATATRMPAGSYNTRSQALGDVDRDGDLDLVLGNELQQNLLYLNDGKGHFMDGTASRMPAGSYNTWSLALGDMDGDGDLDLVVGNGYPGQQSRLYLNDGKGQFTDWTASRLPVGSYVTESLAFGDVDGDRDLDLVLGNWNQQSRLYLNDGKGQFTDATATRLPAGSYETRSLALGDVDSDGDPDLVLGNYWSPSRLYLNNGNGQFTDATVSRLPVGIWAIPLALGDVDRDGDLDLVVGNNRRPGMYLYLNLVRQLDAPYVLHVGRNYQLDVYSRYGPATLVEVAFPYLSTGSANIPLPPLGTIGIDITQMIALPPFVVLQPAGIGSLTIPIPNLPALAGVPIYTQALLVQHPVQERLTNVVRDIMLR